MTTATEPVIRLWDIPQYFSGGTSLCSGTSADAEFDHALSALIALTGRGVDDPAITLIASQLDDAHAKLLDMACDYGRCIPDGTGSSLSEWDDDVLFEVTGFRRSLVHPDTPT